MSKIKLVKVDKEGKILNLTEKELQEMLDEAYDEGYADACEDGTKIDKEYIPVPYYPYDWWKPYVSPTYPTITWTTSDPGHFTPSVTYCKNDDPITLL